MKFSEIKELTAAELRKRGAKMREELFEMKMKHALGQVANPLELRARRKDLARVMTALSVKLSQ